MKVALVHDYLNQYGGGERVLEALLEIFPQAHVYALFYDPAGPLAKFKDKIHKTSFLDFNLARKRHRFFIPLMPLAAKTLDLGDRYDLIISDTAGYAKGISYKPGTFHICYCHTPLRYAWETDNYFDGRFFKALWRPVFSYLRAWDKWAAQKPNVMLSNSAFIANKIKSYYKRDAAVVHPPVDQRKFFYQQPPKGFKHQYYLAVGRLLHYKKFNLVIDAFKELNLPLKIVGQGPELKNIKKQIANVSAEGGSASGGKNIELLPFISDEELRDLYANAKALIFPQVEDFGLVAAEAQVCGTPVIALAAGGALEIVKEGITGLFFRNQSISDLVATVRVFEKMKFNRRRISREGARFSFDKFKSELLANIPQHLHY